jgi:hypothetical protein
MTVKEYILKEANCKTFDELKKKLFKAKKYEYGCYYSEIKCKSFKAFYTSNDNCFCSYGFMFYGIGMASTLGIDKSSITQAGIKRGVSSHYVTDKFLEQSYK